MCSGSCPGSTTICDGPALILCAILSLELSGCVGYYTFVNVSWVDIPPSSGVPKRWENVGEASVLTDAEVEESAEVVGQVAHQFGLGSTDITALRDCSGSNESGCNDRVIGFYNADEDYRTRGEEHGVMGLSILLYKSTGRILIFINDRTNLGPTSYTTRLAESIKAALSERLPANRIEIAGGVKVVTPPALESRTNEVSRQSVRYAAVPNASPSA
jgi:hypothetical protein